MIIILMLLLNTCLLKSAANPGPQLSLRTANQIAADQKLALFLKRFSPKSITELTAANQLRIDAEKEGEKNKIEQARHHYVRTVALTPEILAIPNASEEISEKLSGEARTALIAKIAESKAQLQRLPHPHALAPAYNSGHILTYVALYPGAYPGAPAYVAAYPGAPAYNPTYVAEVMHQQAHHFVLPASSLSVPQTTTFTPGPIFRAVDPAATSLAVGPTLPNKGFCCTHKDCSATFTRQSTMAKHLRSSHPEVSIPTKKIMQKQKPRKNAVLASVAKSTLSVASSLGL